MRAEVQGKLVRAEVSSGEGRTFVKGEFYQRPEEGKAEMVEFFADADEGGKGLADLAEGTLCTFRIAVKAKESQYGSAYLSVKVHSYYVVVAPSRAATPRS